MPRREEITTAMEKKLAESRKALDGLKAKMAEAGEDTSEELSEAVDRAEAVLARGRVRLKEMAEASDEEFEELWDDTKETWRELSGGIERRLGDLSDRVKGFFR